MSSGLRVNSVLAIGAVAAGLLVACGANGEGAPAEAGGCPVGAAATSCASPGASTPTAIVDPCAHPTPAPAGADDFCRRVAVTHSQADGLQYGDITVGSGRTVKSGDKIQVQYTGWLQATGVAFDSSRQPGRGAFPVTLGSGGVIAGWEEGIPGMNVGGKRRLIIPASLGYGAQGNPPVIPPNAVLVFDVEIVSAG